MSRKTESEVLSLAESDDSDSEVIKNISYGTIMIFRSIFQFRLEFFEPMLFITRNVY